MKKTIVQRREIIEDGVLRKEENIVNLTYDSEPNFVKFYVDNLDDLFKITNTSKNILIALIGMCNYDNIIDLPNGKRKQVMSKLDISYAQLDNGLRDLVKKNIISKQSMGVYLLNPMYFGKGSWKNVYEIRQETVLNKDGCFNVMIIQSVNP